MDRTVTEDPSGLTRGLKEAAGYKLVQTGIFQTFNNWHGIPGVSSRTLTLDTRVPSSASSGPGSLLQATPSKLDLDPLLKTPQSLPSACLKSKMETCTQFHGLAPASLLWSDSELSLPDGQKIPIPHMCPIVSTSGAFTHAVSSPGNSCPHLHPLPLHGVKSPSSVRTLLRKAYPGCQLSVLLQSPALRCQVT